MRVGSLRYTAICSRFMMVILMVIIVQNMDRGGTADAARILGIFPTPSFSHQLPFQTLMKLLVTQGHHITVLSTDPLKVPVNNYTDVDFSFSYKIKERVVKFENIANEDGTAFINLLINAIPQMVDEQFESSQMEDFIRSNGKKRFDLVFIEWSFYYSYLGLIHSLGSPPIVGIVSLGGMNSVYNDLWNPNHPAVNVEPLFSFSDRMLFWQRAVNAFAQFCLTLTWNVIVLPAQEFIMRKHFGEEPTATKDARNNVSLLILNNHWTTEYPRAMLPNVIQIAGIHIQDYPEQLPQDLQKWMDDSAADGGVVYFSLGSNVLSKDLPPSKRTAILRAFARLPMKVLWKFEADELPGLPANVRVSKWLAQQAVLAHPNVRLFITQGGLQSFQEAVYHAVPLLAIPFFFDQHFNAEKIVTSQVGRKMDFSVLDENILHSQIMDILRNQSYKDNARRLSTLFREHRVSSLDNALWWVDYVLRHKGAPHLRSSALHLTWYQYLLLDVLAVVLLASYVLYFVIRTILRLLHDIITNQENVAKHCTHLPETINETT